MKSPMIETASYIKPEDKPNYTELKVLRSNAGYYVGTEYIDAMWGFATPGSRDSEYFRTALEAFTHLADIEAGLVPTRMEP